MAINNSTKFERLKKAVETKKSELSEAKGQLSVIQKKAKEVFGTDDVKELTAMKENMEKEQDQIKSKIQKLEKKLENVLEDMSDE